MLKIRFLPHAQADNLKPLKDKIYIATRGSALALAQSNMILAQCKAALPQFDFELKIIKTTGDKLQTVSLAKEGQDLPKGLFTKELEVALLDQTADFAVHSLKDLPTELPPGLTLGAVGRRADVRDVLLYRDRAVAKNGGSQSTASVETRRGFRPGLRVEDLPSGAVVATSSTRRKAQLLEKNPKLQVPDIRGNVLTRMIKLTDKPDLDATVLALAGITRLGYRISSVGKLEGNGIPEGLLAMVLELDVMLPCVGQGAIGIEIRQNDPRTSEICDKLNHLETFQAVTAERSFLAGMGGGCLSPVAAFAEVKDNQLKMRAISFASGPVRRADAVSEPNKGAELGRQLADKLRDH